MISIYHVDSPSHRVDLVSKNNFQNFLRVINIVHRNSMVKDYAGNHVRYSGRYI
jgi:hypothetical protein